MQTLAIKNSNHKMLRFLYRRLYISFHYGIKSTYCPSFLGSRRQK